MAKRPAAEPKSRKTIRNCGAILGRLDEMVPFLFLAQLGRGTAQAKRRRTESHSGLFVLGRATGGSHPGVALNDGLILPLSLCHDNDARNALLDVLPLLGRGSVAKVADRRRKIQEILNAAFQDDLRIFARKPLSGFLELAASRGFFHRLHESFEYVVEVEDDPAGLAHIRSSEPFPWTSHGDLMEWYHGLGYRWGTPWEPFTPYFVTDGTEPLTSYLLEARARDGVNIPQEFLATWFTIRNDVRDSHFGVRLEMGRHGWVFLHLEVGSSSLKIDMSEVFDPLEVFVAWCQLIDEGDVPVEMEVDEEGTDKVLTVLNTDDPERVLFRVKDLYGQEIFLESVVSRPTMASTLKQEVYRFFTQEFDTKHWDGRHPGEERRVQERILSNSWFDDLRTQDAVEVRSQSNGE